MVPHIKQSKARILKILNEITKSSRKSKKQISNIASRIDGNKNLRGEYISQGEIGDLKEVVEDILKKREAILEVASRVDSPFFLLDAKSLEKDITEFKQNFAKHLPTSTPFYAIKCNDHPAILEAVARHGFGMDASSGRELELAKKFGAQRILFSGPGKTQAELQLTLSNAENVTVNIDSWGELEKLGRMAQEQKITIKAGIRIFLQSRPTRRGEVRLRLDAVPKQGRPKQLMRPEDATSRQETWSKFGIPLTDLKKFWIQAKKYPYIALQGIQFHTSWNKDPSAYVHIIGELGAYLKQNFTAAMRKKIRYIDFGGGFFPDKTEGFYPWTAHYPNSLPAGKIIKMADAHFGVETQFEHKYYITRSAPLEDFAKDIAAAFKEHLEPMVQCEYFTEPGRIIATRAQHIVLRITDCKTKDRVIADGGVNMVGWEYGESFYYPMVNLTQPASEEIPCTVFGPLCTPHDVWGYYIYAKKISDGDVIVIPNQGAYKAVLAQNFIKPIPPLHVL